MDYKEILNKVAPCGLYCSKCLFFNGGEIKYHGARLLELLGSFDRYAERFTELVDPVFKNYPSFKELLTYIVQEGCRGCRADQCKYARCGVISCHREKKVDFCFQCDEFPCEKTNFDPDLKRRWIEMNNRMKEAGVATYYEENKDLPRYK